MKLYSDTDALLLNKEELSALLKEGIKPKWWDANKHHVTYDLISTLLHSDVMLDVPIKSQELLIKQALRTLDNSIVLLSTVLLKLHRRSWNQFLTRQRKKVEIRFKYVPVMTNPDKLVGKRVEHLTFD